MSADPAPLVDLLGTVPALSESDLPPGIRNALATFETPVFDALRDAARAVLGVPYALIFACVDDQFWSKSADGFRRLDQPCSSSCLFVRMAGQRGILVVTDTHDDPKLLRNPFVARERGLRFFAGVPIKCGERIVGAICGIDLEPRPAPPQEAFGTLEKLAEAAMAALALKQSEAALAAQSRLLQTTLDSVSQGVSAFDKDLRLIGWNRRMSELLEYPSPLFVGMRYEDIALHLARNGSLGEGDAEQLVAERAAALRRFEPYVREMLYPHDRIVEIRGAPVAGGGFVATHTDVTAEREMARRLRRKAARFQLEARVSAIANAAPNLAKALEQLIGEICVEMGFAYGVVWQGAAAAGERLTAVVRYQREAMADFPIGPGEESRLARQASQELGKPLFPHRHPALRDAPEDEAAGFLLTTEILGKRYVIEALGGKPVRPSSWYGEAMSLLGRQLDHVAARDHVRALKNGFISTMNHELRTPLTAIAGAIDLVHAGVFGPLEPEADKLLGIAQTNARRLGALIGDILDLGDLESDEFSFPLSELEIRPVVEEAVGEMLAEAEARGVTLLLHEGADAQILGHGPRLRQAIRALLSNAIKFSPSGGTVTVRICTREMMVRVAVADQGSGVPEAFRPYLFKKFSRGDTSDARRVGGTGLGLALVKSIADRMGAEVGLRDSETRGATFFIDLHEAQGAIPADQEMPS